MAELLLNIETLPTNSDLHHWADYVELRCLTDPDGLLSLSQLIDMIREGRDKGEAKPDSFGGDIVSTDEIDDALILDEATERLDDDDDPAETADPWASLDTGTDDPADLTDAEKQDALYDLASTIFDRLAWRADAFGQTWPFEMRTSGLIALVDNTPARRNYIFFLLSSCLRWFSLSHQSSLTTAFERVCELAFKKAYTGWEVHLFGTSAAADGRYTGQLFPRLETLAEDLRCSLVVTKEDFKDPDYGDNGLDIVAWLPLPAGSRGLPLAFAQCGCGASNWKSKQSETSEDHWRSTLDLRMPVTNWTFIPFCYHGSGGAWENGRHVNVGVLADRLRICALLGEELNTPLPHVPDHLLADVGMSI